MTVVTAYIHIYAYIQHICVVGNFSAHMNKILVEYLKTVSIQIFGFKLDYIQQHLLKTEWKFTAFHRNLIKIVAFYV
jgi:hypothetical protein